MACTRRNALGLRVTPGGGDAQHQIHCGHRINGLIRSHVLEDLPCTEPVSRANQAAAFLESPAPREAGDSSDAIAILPRVHPSSDRPHAGLSFRSAWRTQLRTACAEHSKSRAISPGVRSEYSPSSWRLILPMHAATTFVTLSNAPILSPPTGPPKERGFRTPPVAPTNHGHPRLFRAYPKLQQQALFDPDLA